MGKNISISFADEDLGKKWGGEVSCPWNCNQPVNSSSRNIQTFIGEKEKIKPREKAVTYILANQRKGSDSAVLKKKFSSLIYLIGPHTHPNEEYHQQFINYSAGMTS